MAERAILTSLFLFCLSHWMKEKKESSGGGFLIPTFSSLYSIFSSSRMECKGKTGILSSSFFFIEEDRKKYNKGYHPSFPPAYFLTFLFEWTEISFSHPCCIWRLICPKRREDLGQISYVCHRLDLFIPCLAYVRPFEVFIPSWSRWTNQIWFVESLRLKATEKIELFQWLRPDFWCATVKKATPVCVVVQYMTLGQFKGWGTSACQFIVILVIHLDKITMYFSGMLFY